MKQVHGYHRRCTTVTDPNRHEELSEDVDSVLYPDDDTEEVEDWEDSSDEQEG